MNLDDMLFQLLELEQVAKYNKIKFFAPDKWQIDLFTKGVAEKIRGCLAANRMGKSYAATYELCLHLTGMYPDWWTGHRFDQPIDAMMLGSTWTQIMGQKAIHELVFGPINDFGSGWIPKDCIIDIKGAGKFGAVGFCQVRHISGGTSSIRVGTYGQGDTNIMGSALSFFLVDEDPEDQTIIAQLVKRGWSIPNSRGLVVMTPEKGRTQSVELFWEKEAIYHSGLVHKTLFDSSLYSDEQKQEFIKSIPPWARKFSIYGEPSAGHGAVFAGINKDNITLPTPQLGDDWKRVSAIDFGKRDQNVVEWLAHDPTTDSYYFYDELSTSGKDAHEIAPMILPRQQKYIPLVWPADGAQERGTGVTLIQIYRDGGIITSDEPAMNWALDATGKSRGIEPGIAYMRKLMMEGRLFISPKCVGLLKELELYSYDDNGKFIDKDNHHIDAARYALMNIIKYGASPTDSVYSTSSYVPDKFW